MPSRPGAFLDPSTWNPFEAAAYRTRRGVVEAPGGPRSQTTVDKTLAELMIPQNAAEVALYGLGGGMAGQAGRKLGAKGLAGLMGLAGAASYSDEAEAGPLNVLKKGIKAYHGSPHNFDKFDMSKIGTGEGAQSYGHGLYFADQEATAKAYRDALKWRGADWDNPQTIAANSLWGSNAQGDKAKAIDALEGALAAQKRQWPDRPNKPLEDAIALLRRNDEIVGKPPTPGRMYEVNLNVAPEQLLDWDKPLSRQSADVQGVMRKFGIEAQPEQMRAYDDALLAALQDKGPATLPKQPWDPLGANIYESSKIVPGGYSDKVAAASALREAGIPGIRYLDQGSRAAGEGSRNYVMFDDSLIEIKRKYGLAGASPLGAMMGLGATDQAQAMDTSQLPMSQNVQVVPETQRFIGPTPTQLYEYRNQPVNQSPQPNDLASLLGLMDIGRQYMPLQLGTRP